jgi:phospholipid-binding lipoprotein MlaA
MTKELSQKKYSVHELLLISHNHKGEVYITKIRIYDPIEKYNRVVFKGNNLLYRYLLGPVMSGYSFIIPRIVRMKLSNMKRNLTSPVRLISSLLQGKMKQSLIVCERFGINSTLGVLGLFDVACRKYELHYQNEGMGQVLSSWGMTPGPYIVLPILGSSTIREIGGAAMDACLNPLTWIRPQWIGLGFSANDASFLLERYRGIIEDSRDPYTRVRDGWYVFRNEK